MTATARSSDTQASVRDAVRVMLLRALGAVLVRTAVLVLLYVGFLAVLDRVESTDPLGAGLLFFLVVLVVSLAWGVWDGWQRGFLHAAVVWVLVGAAAGFGIVAGSVAVGEVGGSLADGLRDSWLFFALLIAVPGVLGAVPGGLVHRARRAPTA